MQFEAKLTLDGLMTLIAGVIAFIAIIIQIRSSSKQVQDQIKAQRDAEREELERQKRSVATAILYEIDNFYLRHLIDRARSFESWKKMEADASSVEMFKVIIGTPSVVFQASAKRLGELGENVSRAVVVSYGASVAYIELVKWYQDAFAKGASGSGSRERAAVQAEVREAAEQATKLAALACRLLCQITGTSFSTLMIARESCAHTKTVTEQVVRCSSCDEVISRSMQNAQTH